MHVLSYCSHHYDTKWLLMCRRAVNKTIRSLSTMTYDRYCGNSPGSRFTILYSLNRFCHSSYYAQIATFSLSNSVFENWSTTKQFEVYFTLVRLSNCLGRQNLGGGQILEIYFNSFLLKLLFSSGGGNGSEILNDFLQAPDV